ncbi:MAG: polyribonucleotide nucleotidyltransferase [Patescibacteria group bacterium]|nr:polyribonucleotide nucleotidyltransferase [Patescibacteria group bacterium]MDW8279586.1 polyribonucleotide nucleotidyltransferase [bacterium]
MINRKIFKTEFAGKNLTIEISEFADQTNAAALVKYGETIILATAVMSKTDSSADYLPLKVDYEERFYAAGKIIGSRFIRRESRPSEDAILTGRLIDRVIRPLFDQRLRRDIQIVITVLSYDEENDPDFVGLIGASIVLGISDIPWNGPTAGIKIVKIDNQFLINPSNSEIKDKNKEFEIFAAGPLNRINMIELKGNEAQEENVLEAIKIAQIEINKLIEFQKNIITEIGKPKIEAVLYSPNPELEKIVKSFLENKLFNALYEREKNLRNQKLENLKNELKNFVLEKTQNTELKYEDKEIDYLFENEIDLLLHKTILEKEIRPDGRSLSEIRELKAEIGLFQKTHGSAIFIRGNTQSLAIVTLAPPSAEQIIETMEVTTKRRFMLHYNFPPYSVGEIGSFRGPGRREIGHGALAEKALQPLIPQEEIFPYTIRIVSEILSSNGSSSMATVCSSSMALMDAGVPIKKHVAGIAMGLILENENDNANFKVLTDIQGPEDHFGDMDFKVAGTRDGITAIQLDVKIYGLTSEIIKKTLEDAKKAKLKILDFMEKIINAPKSELHPNVPKILTYDVNPEKIGLIIGSGGKVINSIIKKFNLTSIDINENGRIYVSAPELKDAEAALEEIKLISRELKIGDIVVGKVIKNLEFGSIIDLGGGQDALLHISEIKNDYVKNIEDVLKIGDTIQAKVIKIDENGKIGLSIKQLNNN